MACPVYKKDPELSKECECRAFVSIRRLKRHLSEHHGLEDFPDTQSQGHFTGGKDDSMKLTYNANEIPADDGPSKWRQHR
jgi:hypothetical protein